MTPLLTRSENPTATPDQNTAFADHLIDEPCPTNFPPIPL